MIKNTWLLLVAFAFVAGCATQEPPKPEPAPAPIPEPTPEVKPAPPPPAPKPKPAAEKVTFAATVGFDFDRAVVKPEGKANPKTISTANLLVDRVPQQEWAEIFNEVWRRYRDFYYAPNMHGYDWDALRKQYAALVPFVAHRSDLNYVLGEMVSELSTSHSYIEGGDYEMPKRPQDAANTSRMRRQERPLRRFQTSFRAPAEAGRELFWYFGSYSCTSTPPLSALTLLKPSAR